MKAECCIKYNQKKTNQTNMSYTYLNIFDMTILKFFNYLRGAYLMCDSKLQRLIKKEN